MKSFLFTLTQLLFSLTMYCLGTIFLGLALVPSLTLIFKVWSAIRFLDLWARIIYLGFSLAAGFFIFGLTLIILVGLVRSGLGLRLKEGTHAMFSWEAAKWALVSSLYLVVNFTFIDFILLTPFVNLLQRLLGAKLGKNVQINSKFVFDATLLEIGDNSVVGGGAVIIGHQVERGFLKLKKVKIGKNVTIGSNSIITPGCEIGDNAIIGAGAVLLKNTKVEPHTVYFGVPAQNVHKKEHKASDEKTS